MPFGIRPRRPTGPEAGTAGGDGRAMVTSAAKATPATLVAVGDGGGGRTRSLSRVMAEWGSCMVPLQ